jgi:hypothetical protein
MSESDDYEDHDLPPPGLLVRLGSRRKLWVWLAALAAATALIGVGVRREMKWDGVGHYNQSVILETDRRIHRVTYAAWQVDDELKQAAEASADPAMFDCEEAELQQGKRFTARIWFTESGGPLRRTRVAHYPHLVVYVDFEDGCRVCRVVDLPADTRPPPITIRLP